MITHAAIVPLIGGLPIGQAQCFESRPLWMASYSAFAANDAQIRNYWKDIPYEVLDSPVAMKLKGVDVVGSTCPCAGLSSLSTTSSASSATNDWLYHTSEYVLEQVKPRVLWGENAPRLASNAGKPVVDRLRKIGAKHGYSLALYRTKTLLHGGHQIRDRSFFFFFDTPNKVPALPFIFKEREQSVANYIRSIPRKSSDPHSMILTDEKTPSLDPLYFFLLNEIEKKTHREFAQSVDSTCYVHDYVEKFASYDTISAYLRERGYAKYADKCIRMRDKLASGGNIMRRGVIVPADYTGAFVGSMPSTLTHPDEDRYLTIREALSMMYMPEDFELVGGRSNLNMICQNVPVKTAASVCNIIKDYLHGRLDSINTSFAVFDNKTLTFATEKSESLLEF